MAVAQYLVYFLIGAFFLFVMAAFFSVAAGVAFLGIVLVFLPLFLAGYASGLSFFYPRIAAIASIILVFPYFIFGIYHIFAGAVGFNPMVFVIPSIVVILISVFALLWNKPSLWSRQKETFGKVAIWIFAGLPALLATLMLASSLIRIGSAFLRRAT